VSADADDARTVLKLASMATTVIYNLRKVAGVTSDIDIEVSDRMDDADLTAVVTMRVKVRGVT